MFKKHSVQMKIVKDAPQTPDQTDWVVDYNYALSVTEMMAERMLKKTTQAIIVVIGAKTTTELLLHIAKTRIK